MRVQDTTRLRARMLLPWLLMVASFVASSVCGVHTEAYLHDALCSAVPSGSAHPARNLSSVFEPRRSSCKFGKTTSDCYVTFFNCSSILAGSQVEHTVKNVDSSTNLPNLTSTHIFNLLGNKTEQPSLLQLLIEAETDGSISIASAMVDGNSSAGANLTLQVKCDKDQKDPNLVVFEIEEVFGKTPGSVLGSDVGSVAPISIIARWKTKLVCANGNNDGDNNNGDHNGDNNNGNSKGRSWFGSLILIFILMLVCYFAIGFVYRRSFQGHVGFAQVPHHSLLLAGYRAVVSIPSRLSSLFSRRSQGRNDSVTI